MSSCAMTLHGPFSAVLAVQWGARALTKKKVSHFAYVALKATQRAAVSFGVRAFKNMRANWRQMLATDLAKHALHGLYTTAGFKATAALTAYIATPAAPILGALATGAVTSMVLFGGMPSASMPRHVEKLLEFAHRIGVAPQSTVAKASIVLASSFAALVCPALGALSAGVVCGAAVGATLHCGKVAWSNNVNDTCKSYKEGLFKASMQGGACGFVGGVISLLGFGVSDAYADERDDPFAINNYQPVAESAAPKYVDLGPGGWPGSRVVRVDGVVKIVDPNWREHLFPAPSSPQGLVADTSPVPTVSAEGYAPAFSGQENIPAPDVIPPPPSAPAVDSLPTPVSRPDFVPSASDNAFRDALQELPQHVRDELLQAKQEKGAKGFLLTVDRLSSSLGASNPDLAARIAEAGARVADTMPNAPRIALWVKAKVAEYANNGIGNTDLDTAAKYAREAASGGVKRVASLARSLAGRAAFSPA